MTIQELQKQIINKQFNNLYVFLGEEIAVQKIYINKIQELTNLELTYIEDIKSIYNKLQSNNILNIKHLYVVIDDIDLVKQEKIWSDLESKTNGNIIILKYNNLDKRSKFYKQFSSKLVEFEKLSDIVLTKYIQKELTLNTNNCKKLIDICNSNYNQILLEIDKIKNYDNFFDNDDYLFTELDNKGAFHKEISDITFDFIEKVLKRDIKAVYELRKKLIQIGESNIKLLSLLYTNFKTVLLIQSCKSNDICKTTGLQYYQVKYNQDKLNYYSIGELVYCIKLLQYIESNIKQGLLDEAISIDYFLINVL